MNSTTIRRMLANKPDQDLLVLWQSGQCFAFFMEDNPTTTRRCGLDLIPETRLIALNDGNPLEVDGPKQVRELACLCGWKRVITFQEVGEDA